MILVFAVSLVCWGAGYFYSTGFPMHAVENQDTLWYFIGKIFINKEIGYIVGFLTLLISGFAVQRISDTEMLAKERTRLPFMLFLLFFSVNTFLLPVSEATIIIICLVVYFFELFRAYQAPEAGVSFFGSGLALGMASLFAPQMLFFLPLMWVGMYKFRALEWKTFWASLVAVLMIYWILLAWCVWTNDFSLFAGLWNGLIHIRFSTVEALFQYDKLPMWSVVILSIISLIHNRMHSFNTSNRTRMILSFLTDNIILTVALIFLYNDNAVIQAILYVPAAILIARFLRSTGYRMAIFLFFVMSLLLLFSFIISTVWNF
jgi:hypothetical protein